MLRNSRWKVLAALMVLLMLAVFSACAGTNASSLDDMEKYMQENFSSITYKQFLAACKAQKGEDFAREKAIYYYSFYPDNIDIAWGVLRYCDPFSEPERIIEAGATILRDYDLPAYSEDMPKKPHEADVGYCSGVYMAYVYAYYQLGDEEQMVKAADWLVSYAEYEGYMDESQLRTTLSACNSVTYYFVQHGRDEKALPYAKKVEDLLNKYSEQYPDALEKFLPEYEIIFAPLLEKYAQEQGQ